MSRRLAAAAVPVGAALILAGCAAGSGTVGGRSAIDDEPEYAWVAFGADSIRVEVARTPAARERGLMGRENLPEGTGMLFVFPTVEIQGVWMKDTPLRLDVAFLDDRATVLGIEALEPHDLTVTYAPAPVRYVLETRRGWFARHGVGPGDRANIAFDGP
jgi:uncharacterized membrane protein (UPF0127 family)